MDSCKQMVVLEQKLITDCHLDELKQPLFASRGWLKSLTIKQSIKLANGIPDDFGIAKLASAEA